MTDTGQVPGEGLPESAGMVEQPGVPAHGAYHYLSGAPAEDDELLLPGAQGAWGNEVPPPAPEPVVEAVHEPGPHETAGRDTGSVDLSGVRLPDPASVSAAASPVLSAPPSPHDQAAASRRPLHLGPPTPDASASPVRSLADRGPADAPVRQQGAPAAGPEYLDVQPLRDLAPQGAAPWSAPQAPVAQANTRASVAETVAPADLPGPGLSGVAPPAVPRLAPGAVVAGGTAVAARPAQPAGPALATVEAPGSGPEPQGPPDLRTAHGPEHGQGPAHDGTHAAADGPAPEGAHGPAPVGAQGPAPVGAQGPVAVGAQGQVAAPGGPGSGYGPDGGPRPDVAPPAAPAPGPDGTQGGQAVLVTPDAPRTEATPAPGTVQGTVPQETAPQDPAAAHGAQARPEDGARTPAAQAPHAAQAVFAPEAAPHAVQDPQATTAGQPGVVSVPPATGPAPLAPTGDAAQTPAAGTPTAALGTPTPAAGTPTAAPGTPTPAAGVPVPGGAPQQAEAGAPAPAEGPHPEQAPPGAPVPEQATDGPQGQPSQQAAAADPHGAAPAGPVPTAPEDPTAATPSDPAAPAHEATGPQAAPPAPETAEPQTVPGPQTAPGAQLRTPAQAEPGTVPAPTPDEAVPAEPARPDEPAAETPAGAPAGLSGGESPGEPTPPPGAAAEPDTEHTQGQFVPVDGTVPTPPHLAPAPPQPVVLPAQEQGEPQPVPAAPQEPEPVASVPGPREAEPAAAQSAPDAPDVVQQAADLETRAADQEEDTATEPARPPAGPAAPGYADAEREAVLKVMRERRDIRNGFRDDPIPHEVLLRVLEAAHTAPSVGHSQPWDFVVIRSAETRRTMHELAMRQRDAYAKSLPKGRAKQFKELKIEAILDTPVNIVVTADPTRGGRHTLGRHTQPQMAPYSSALAVENLWLAARAEGLGVGWVSFFDEREMVRALGLPEHLEVVAYLCVGYVDEFPDEPELAQAGWSKRRPLSWVVHEETYGRRALPGEDPHDLLAETVAGIRPLDAKALGEAWERQKRMTKPAGALGMLEIISAQLAGLSRQCPPPIPEPAAVAVFAGDHGVHAQGVTPWPQEVTAQMVANFLGGGAVCNAFAGQVGAEVCVVDVGVATDLPATPGLLPRKVRAGTADMTTGPAMTREEVKQAIEVGIETARDLVAAGNKALLTGEMGIANTTASAALIAVFTGADPAEVTGRGTGINDETLARKTEVVRRALDMHQPDPADPIGVLAAVGGLEHAAIVGLLLGGASLRTPVILDGVSAGAAALVARAIAPEVLAACIAGHRSAEPGHVAALNKLGLRPLVDLDLRLGEGTGALLALPLVQSTARAMHEVATFDSAGVTEK
ncbi:nicotinate-nucleotide--dimethylbenzimidazole phosphoribosyltransferase [Streptomyces sp. MMS24-I2-30]|uniref:nicotinate-nucleotide--dimethylbenzimidazole phosphoribosyltransferase n=1 Tax=Streptomyces sp. MMS24-I2-30 TaxID=3351564 RepID=UPI003896B1C8